MSYYSQFLVETHLQHTIYNMYIYIDQFVDLNI